jgi:hypothetical protein
MHLAFQAEVSGRVLRGVGANKKALSVRQCLILTRGETRPVLTAVPYVEERAHIHGLDGS